MKKMILFGLLLACTQSLLKGMLPQRAATVERQLAGLEADLAIARTIATIARHPAQITTAFNDILITAAQLANRYSDPVVAARFNALAAAAQAERQSRIAALLQTLPGQHLAPGGHLAAHPNGGA